MKMAFYASLLFLFTLLFFLSTNTTTSTVQTPSSPPLAPPPSLLNAVETLRNARYNAMALTLEALLTSQHQSHISFSSPFSFTIFSPPDSAFNSAGQPSLSLLLYHLSPLSFSQSSLSSLRNYSVIPTLSPFHTPLYITSPPINSSEISINGVKVSPMPIFDDGSIVVYGIEDFFNPNVTFLFPRIINQVPKPNCTEFSTSSKFLEASSVLKSRGYSIMASFLDLQLIGFLGIDNSPAIKLTLFCPVDEALVDYSGSFLDYSSLFLRHLLPCKISWSDMNGIENGTIFKHQYLQGGYSIKIEKLEDKTIMVNGVKITAPEMYNNDLIVLHGLQQLIPVVNTEEEEIEQIISVVKLMKKTENMCISQSHGEF